MLRNAMSLLMLWLLTSSWSPKPTEGVTPQKDNQQRGDSQTQVAPNEQELRQRAFYIADAMVPGDGSDDDLQAAHMRADFASLLCLHGERRRGAEIIRKSIRDVVSRLVSGDENDQGPSDTEQLALEALELPVRLSELIDNCEPDTQFSIADEISRIRVEREGPELSLKIEPDVVSDQLWGSKPSARRQLPADILARSAHQKAAERKLPEAERLLSRSLDFCVTGSLIGVLGGLADRGGAQAAARLFFKAVERAKAKPSGSELHQLSFVIFMHMRSKGSSGQNAGTSGGATDRYLQAYLEAVVGLVRDVNSNLAGKSADTIRMVKQSLSYPVILEPTVRREIEEWIAAMTRNLSPEGQAAVVRSPFHPEPPERKVAKLEEIAAKSIDARERDAAHASIASTHIAWGKFDEAREAISRIGDPALQRDMLDDVTYRQTSFSLAKKAEARPLMEEIGKVARIPTRIKLYVRVAKASGEKDKVLALETLQEAAVLAGKLGPSAMQSHFLLTIADAYADFDAVRAFEMLHESIRSINRHREQPASRWGPVWIATTAVDYEDPRFPRNLYENPEDYRKPYDFSFIRKLAWIDFDGVMLAAATLQDKVLQASVKYELCAGILEKGKPNKPRAAGPIPD